MLYQKHITVIHTLMAVAAMQGQGKFGVQYLAQGRFNMQTRGIEPGIKSFKNTKKS